MFATEHEFTLPFGYFDGEKLHRTGCMRLATAGDELKAQADPKAKASPERLPVLLLSRVVTQLGELDSPQITQDVIESLYVADFNFLQEMYNTVNAAENPQVIGECPQCGGKVKLPINFTGAAG
jgi:phage FluMu protein gp41